MAGVPSPHGSRGIPAPKMILHGFPVLPVAGELGWWREILRIG